MKSKVFLGLILVVFTLGIVIYSIQQTKKLEKEFAPAIVPGQVTLGQKKPELKPNRPEDYGMVVTDSLAPTLTQEYWNNMISAKVKEIKSQAPKDILDKAQAKIKEDTAKTDGKLKQIDEAIEKCKVILAKNPLDAAAKSKLEHMYMLKSIARELPQ